jgi:hypothetical protein
MAARDTGTDVDRSRFTIGVTGRAGQKQVIGASDVLNSVLQLDQFNSLPSLPRINPVPDFYL